MDSLARRKRQIFVYIPSQREINSISIRGGCFGLEENVKKKAVQGIEGGICFFTRIKKQSIQAGGPWNDNYEEK